MPISATYDEPWVGERSGLGKRGYFAVWLTSVVFLTGYLALRLQETSLVPYFFTLAYLTLLIVFARSCYIWSDPFNPLCLILAAAFFRFCCPGLLLLAGAEPPDDVEAFFQLMKLSGNDWHWGHVLALTGILAFVLGWLLAQSRAVDGKPLNFYLRHGTKYAALAAMLVGSMALFVFFVSNASFGAIFSGSFRSTTVQEGTGTYFRLSYLLMAGSVLLSCYLMARNRGRLAVLAAGVSTILYWPLGGRGRAMSSVAAALVLLWYVRREKSGWKRISFKPIHVLLAFAGVLFFLWISYVGVLYRGEAGAQAFSESLSLSGLSEYAEHSIFTDIGQLTALAGAIAIGPGVLGGQTFIGSFTWPLGKFMAIPGRSAGVYIVEALAGFSDDEHRWGVNASLIGDAYLNFGLGGVAIVMAVFGTVLKLLYLKFRQGILHPAIYALALISSLQAFVVSIEVWPQAVITLGFALAVIYSGSTIFRLR